MNNVFKKAAVAALSLSLVFAGTPMLAQNDCDNGTAITAGAVDINDIDFNKFKSSFIHPLKGEGTQRYPYQINDVSDWNSFCYLLQVNDKSFSQGKYFRLNSDISVTTMAGTPNHDFCGTFEGKHHTITFNYSGNEEGIAPFHYVENAHIGGLRTAGNITTSAKYAGGIVGFSFGGIQLCSCSSNIRIDSSVQGDGTHGGLIGIINSSNANASFIKGCVFGGSFYGTETTCWGGFVGWTNTNIPITYSFFQPDTLQVNPEGSATFIRNGSNVSACVYRKLLGLAQGISQVSAEETETPEVSSISYTAHVQNYGWLDAVSSSTGSDLNAALAGTTEQNLRMEALTITLTHPNGESGISYRVHVQNYGWMDWCESGQTAGTTGQGLRMEAIEISLDDEYAANYDVYYQVHMSGIGWGSWVKNGETAGTTGQSRAIEAIRIQLVPNKK